MIIKSVKLTNFKCFKGAKFLFDPMTLLKGRNGSGKTTVALEALLFALYGYTSLELLSDLPTKGVSKSCSVEVELKKDENTYVIKRSYPTKLSIRKNDKNMIFSTSVEGNKYIYDLLGSREYFQKFRVIDTAKESNLLEQGNIVLKRVIFAESDAIFNTIRKRLFEIKNERERFNKDQAVVHTHYPSEKRLQLISSKIQELEEQDRDLYKTVIEFEKDYRKVEREIGHLEQRKKTVKNNQDKVRKENICFTCKQKIPNPTQKELVNEINKEIKEINSSLSIQNSEVKDLKDLVESHRKIQETVSTKLQKLSHLKIKLEGRLHQKDFIYTNKDVEIVKRTIKELDNLSTYYLTETTKVLEPIINSILENIHFYVKFEIDNKGKFVIRLQNNNIIYKYKDLSTGQKLLLQIAFKLALLLQNNDTGIVIADEGMSSLDSENLQHILQIFEGLPFQLFLVLHRFEDIPENIKTINLDEYND